MDMFNIKPLSKTLRKKFGFLIRNKNHLVHQNVSVSEETVPRELKLFNSTLLCYRQSLSSFRNFKMVHIMDVGNV